MDKLFAFSFYGKDVNPDIKDIVAFGLLFVVLLLRPQGMFGKVLERKA